MAQRVKLTRRVIDRLAPVTKETWLMDSEVIGFGIRQRPNAGPVYSMRWKDKNSRDRKMKIGPVAGVELEAARNIARQRLGEIALGDNPIEKRRAERFYHQTVSDLVERVIEEMASTRAPHYVANFKQQMRDYVEPTIGATLVRDVTASEIDRILGKVRDRPALHNRIRAGLSKLMNKAIRWGYRPNNPVFGTELRPEAHRTRLIDDAEMASLLDTLTKHPGPSSDAMRLLFSTGARPQELLAARWHDFDLVAGVWSRPAQTVKQRRTLTVTLDYAAVAILKRMSEAAHGAAPESFIFPSHGVTGHLTTIRNHARKMFAEAGIKDARPYDLRKAFASRLVAAGNNLAAVMSLTGHTQVAILLKHYAHVMPGGQRAALDSIFGKLTPPAGTKV